MQKVNDCYAGLSYTEIYDMWSHKDMCAGYKPHELLQIHRKWKSLGKQVAQGAAVRLDGRKRRG